MTVILTRDECGALLAAVFDDGPEIAACPPPSDRAAARRSARKKLRERLLPAAERLALEDATGVERSVVGGFEALTDLLVREALNACIECFYQPEVARWVVRLHIELGEREPFESRRDGETLDQAARRVLEEATERPSYALRRNLRNA